MKKLLMLIAFAGIMIPCSSQSKNFKAFKVDVGLGYAIPSGGGGAKGGLTFTLEPHYRITNKIAAGLRLEGAALGYETVDAAGVSNVKVSLLNSYCLSGEYYFMDKHFRPFAGAGFGLFKQSSISSTSDNVAVVKGDSKFGFYPVAGFEMGHLRLSGSYNILGDNAGYLAFKIGAFFGGGKK